MDHPKNHSMLGHGLQSMNINMYCPNVLQVWLLTLPVGSFSRHCSQSKYIAKAWSVPYIIHHIYIYLSPSKRLLSELLCITSETHAPTPTPRERTIHTGEISAVRQSKIIKIGLRATKDGNDEGLSSQATPQN